MQPALSGKNRPSIMAAHHTGRPRQSKGPAAAAAAAGISSRPGTQEAAEGAAESSWSRARRLRRTKLEVQVRLQAGLMQEALGCTHLAVSSCSPENRTRYVAHIRPLCPQQLLYSRQHQVGCPWMHRRCGQQLPSRRLRSVSGPSWICPLWPQQLSCS